MENSIHVSTFNFERVDYTAICGTCYTIKGSMHYNANQSIIINGDGSISDDELEDIIGEIRAPYFESSHMKCEHCGRMTNHFWVDGRMATVIQKMNKLGYHTMACCEGDELLSLHGSYPYVMIKGYVDLKDCPWKIKKHQTQDGTKVTDIFPTVEDPMVKFMSYIHIKELNDWLDKMLSEKE